MQEWCIPQVSAEFVAAMEAVLALYAQPYNSKQPVICIDESAKELFESVRPALPMQPSKSIPQEAAEKERQGVNPSSEQAVRRAGKSVREDCEYERKGRRDLFVAVEPKGGWRGVRITQGRTARDYAHFIQYIVEEVYAQAEVVHIVQDNLNTHTPGALYKTFPPEEARPLLERVQFHYTPKHGSWLNMAEIEIGIIKRVCLNRRMGEAEFMEQEVAALVAERNARECKINWQFSCEQARTTLHRLYPKLEQQTHKVS